MTAEEQLATFYWPFCIGANKASDYCLVAGPDFLIDEGRVDFFRTRSFELTEVSPTPKVMHVEMAGDRAGFSSVYKARIATLSEETQHDFAGRALYCAVGFIIRDRNLDPAAVQPILSQCDVEMTPILERFLTLDEPNYTPLATTRRAFSPARIAQSDKNDARP